MYDIVRTHSYVCVTVSVTVDETLTTAASRRMAQCGMERACSIAPNHVDTLHGSEHRLVDCGV